MITLTNGAAPAASRKSLPADPIYQTLWARLQAAENGGALARVIGLTSSRRGEGVTTVAANLAVTAAEHGARVLLVDANSTEPALPRLFGVRAEPGLSEVLETGGEIAEHAQASSVANLSLLAAGSKLGGLIRAPERAWAGFLQNAKRDFDWVIVDLPALDQGGATLRMAGLLDGVALVVEAERDRWEVAHRAKESLDQAHAHLLGAVLNKRREHVPNWLYRMS